MRPVIDDFLIDDENDFKFAEHGVPTRRVLQILDGEFVVVKNRRGRRAPYLVIGRDHGGACIAVPIEATGVSGLWRPVTAWWCKESERAMLPRL